MIRLVRSLYRSTLCFASVISFAASMAPGRTTPVERGLAALPGTLLPGTDLDSGWTDERAAASFEDRFLESF
jgi:hypothetical protein